jgi:GMP synthase (glutamine-hydrolysing)
MRVLTIVHEADAGPGVFGDALTASRADLDEWWPAEQVHAPEQPETYGAILSLGGEANPDQGSEYPWLEVEKEFLAGALVAGVPTLGVCLGAELLAEAGGGRNRRLGNSEIGWYEVRLNPAATADPVLRAMDRRFCAFEWHSYETVPPPNATELARSDTCIQAFRIGASAWGIQFHAEVTAEDVEHWFTVYAAAGDEKVDRVDAEAILRQTESEITTWNERGRGLCERFLQLAARR